MLPSPTRAAEISSAKPGTQNDWPLSLPAERSDIRRSVYDRLVNVIITTALSAAIAFHDKWWK